MIDVVVPREAINDIYLPCLNEMARVQIYYGGASSGKSVFLAQRDVIDVMKGGRNFLVCRQVGRTLRGSVVQEITKVIRDWGLSNLFSINKTDGTITCSNGYQIIFAGLDDIEKLKSITPAKGVFTDVRIEEATEIERSSIKQLLKRQRGGSEKMPKRLVLSFNPILQSHFIYEDYFSQIGWADNQKEYKSEDLYILKSTYRDNKFLTAEDVKGLKNEKDKYYFDVYSEGNWGVLGDVIFTNWKVADLLDTTSEYYLPIEQRTHRKHGLDFGFSSDPSAMPTTHYNKKRKQIFIYDELHEYGMTNDVLAAQVKAMIGGDRVTCDSSEPKSVQELRMHGVNAVGAKKGKDSVLHGIQWLQQQEVIIDKRCVKTKTEFQQYQWKKNKDGASIREPSEKNNHLIDALRYGYEDEMITISISPSASVGNYISGNQQQDKRPGF